MAFSCLLDERSMSSGGSIQAVHRSSCSAVRQDDSTIRNRDSRLLSAALHAQERGLNSRRNCGQRLELSALESRSARLSPNSLLVRTCRKLIELQLADALATLGQFDQIARGNAPVAPRSREFAQILRAVL